MSQEDLEKKERFKNTGLRESDFDFSELDKKADDLLEQENLAEKNEFSEIKKIERLSEDDNLSKQVTDDKKTTVNNITSQATQTPVVTKSPQYDQIESILEEGLADIYKELPESLKLEFRHKGEETAFQIDQIMQSVKVKLKDVIELILGWLRMVPGVNKFFIEKEVTIKAKKIFDLKNKNNLE
ncbi:MAG: hypothetical protein WCX88_03610 [Patescibacteria group bacterium]